MTLFPETLMTWDEDDFTCPDCDGPCEWRFTNHYEGWECYCRSCGAEVEAEGGSNLL